MPSTRLEFPPSRRILGGMPFSLFLALRYLKPKRAAVSVITLFCVIGVMLGVGALIVVISVMNGFQEKIREQLLALEPHIVAIQHSGPPAEEDVPRKTGARSPPGFEPWIATWST